MDKQEPWEAYPEVWPSKSSFFSWLRGGFRKAIWQFYPGRIIFKKTRLAKPPKDYKGKAKSGAICALTGVWTGNSKLQVDHIKGEASLKDWDDVVPFIQHLCTTDDNMQLVEIEAHKCKTLAERQGISFKEALIEKKYIIPFKKLNAEKQKQELTKLGINDIMPTQVKRVEQYRNYIKENTND